MWLGATTQIDRPVEEVWRFYAEDFVHNHTRWDPTIVLEQETPGPLRQGSRIRRQNSRSGTVVEGTMEVTEFQPGRSVAMTIHDGRMVSYGRATLAPLDDGRTSLTIGADMPWLDENSDTSAIVAALERSASAIKQLVEAEPRR